MTMPDNKHEDRLLEHEYDGIREYDNPMPRWWLWIFYATIIFVPLYYILPSPFGEGEGMIARYDADVAAARAAAVAAAPVSLPAASDDDLRVMLARADVVAAGKVVYETNCAACHRLDGGGVIGPNLTDDAWIHGALPSQIRGVIAAGVLDKGMPQWERILRPEQVDAVAAYVMSLHGTNPPAPKPPQGPAVTQ
jgi:cytochrome c oxidase cbb3-type subunit 3